MKVLGIICEYNPFHLGHKYHIDESIKKIKPDYVIAIMSGNYVQRGIPAIIDPYSRSIPAIKNGIDLVIELPLPYAISSAEFFSHGAIKTLSSTNIVTDISFGSECEIESLISCAKLLNNESFLYKKSLSKHLKNGNSFPKARQLALLEISYNPNEIAAVENANSILGIEYIKSIMNQESNININTVTRKGSNYNDTYINSIYSSATSIRKAIFEKKPFQNQIPKESYEVLVDKIESNSIMKMELFYKSLIYKLLSLSKKELIEYDYFNDGLAERFKKALNNSLSLEDILLEVKTKRHTSTRINRALLGLLLNIKKNQKYSFDDLDAYQVLHVLAMNNKGKELLKIIKQNSKMPIITKNAQYTKRLSTVQRIGFEWMINATKIYEMHKKNPSERIPGFIFKQTPYLDFNNNR